MTPFPSTLVDRVREQLRRRERDAYLERVDEQTAVDRLYAPQGRDERIATRRRGDGSWTPIRP